MLLWLDLETTGVDERSDPILEVGAVVTTTQPPFDEVASFETVIQPERERWPGWRERMGPYVFKMHSGNGLLAAIDAGGGVSISEAEAALIGVLRDAGAVRGRCLLAGSGVGHFDRRFIAAQMPELNRWLRYPCLDVGVIRRALMLSDREDLVAAGTTYTGERFVDKPHRGLADVRDHLAEFRSYVALFQAVNPVNIATA